MRVHELARELNADPKVLLARLQELGFDARNRMSTLDDAAVLKMRIESVRRPLTSNAPLDLPPPKPAESRPPKSPKPSPSPDVTPEPPTTPTPPPQPSVEPAPSKAPAAETPSPVGPEPTPTPPADTPAEPTATVLPGKILRLRGGVVVKDLAGMLAIRPNQLITDLMQINVLASINQRIEIHEARRIAEKHGFTVEQEKRPTPTPVQPPKTREDARTALEEDRPENLVQKAPVVTFMGHVDHGKTSLLDRIRNAAVAAGEHGGITQHIGAYTLDVNGRQITFLDTPGHAAFTAMRARGANMTDIAVIVIAADDGIMPQTREAIQHAQAAGVSIMIAINKMDLPSANLDRVKKQLQAEELTTEDWGGTIIACPVSAVTGEGMDHLLEMILLQADVLELRANPRARAQGFVIEARLEPGMGPIADLLVTRGTLSIGEAVACGRHWGRVRALINDHGAKVKSAGPATPIRCLGLSGVPEAGSEFKTRPTDKIARAEAEEAALQIEQKTLAPTRKTSLDGLFEQLKNDEKVELKLILKADTQGSVEAIAHALKEIKSEKVTLTILLSGTGNITSNDVMLASASDAVIVGFHVAKESGVDAVARHEGVDVRMHHIIYELIDQVRDAMTGLLAPIVKEIARGRAEVKQVFPLGKVVKVAGCMMVSGGVTPRSRVRVRRGDEIPFEGAIETLRRYQNEATEVREGQECGIRIAGFNDVHEGDTLEFYDLQEEKQTL